MTNNSFPYVDTTIEVKNSKTKFPYRIDSSDVATTQKYLEEGHEVISIEETLAGKRFNVQKLVLRKPNGKTYQNMVTLSEPVAEGLCLRKVGDIVQICILTQTRSPFLVTVEGKKYARFFQEMVGGLAKPGEPLEETAIREILEETGHEVKELHPLIQKTVSKHLSYTDETSFIFYAILGKFLGQKLDEEENIQPVWYDLETVRTEFENYLETKDGTFFGFDMSEMLILALQRFFVKYDRGDIKI